LAQLSADFKGLFEDIIEVLHKVALTQAVPSMLETLDFDAELIKNLSTAMNPEDVQLFYQIALIGKRDLYLSNTPQSALEMTLLRMLSFKPAESKMLDNSSAPAASTNKTTKAGAPSAQATTKESKMNADSKPSALPDSEKKNNTTLKDLGLNHEHWSNIVENVGLQGVAYSLASNCSVESVNDDTIALNLAQQHEGIATKGAQQKIENALQEYFASKINLNIDVSTNELETPAKKKHRAREKIQSEAEKTAETDEAVKALQSQFGAEIIEGTVKPVK